VIRTWVIHSPSKAAPKRSDFRRLNKMSVSNGFYESKVNHKKEIILKGFQGTQ